MKKLILFLSIIFTLDGYSQPGSGPLKVRFIESAPLIDGNPDPLVNALPVNDLDSGGSFRIAYGTDFIYVYAEMAGDTLIFRDRGYQNGDGMIVVIGKPNYGDLPTREFYVMGFTAQPEGMSNWQSKFVWYRNVGLQMTRLQEARFKSRQVGHIIAMECLIPWSEIYPFHPWLSEEIGFNIALVKGIGKQDRRWYFLREDDRIGNEQSPRKTVRLSFETPVISSGTQSYAVLSRNHAPAGESIRIRLAACFSNEQKDPVRVVIYSGEHSRLSAITVERKMKGPVTVTEQEIPCSALASGGYQLEWNSVEGTSKGILYFTILPEISLNRLQEKLQTKKQGIAPGSYATIMFMLQDVKTGLDSLKPYETAWLQRTRIEEITALVSSDKDIIAGRKGIFRRGFFSAVDSTYKPYSVNVPWNLEEVKKYPLMVFLHGSGQDDRNILEQLPDYGTEMIIIAPNGRGTSNCYTADHAQEDIEEAVKDVIRNYPVDTTRIILAGFSMGGYGVYRTFYEHPSRYRALAVFSGSPDLGRRWISGEQPDFLEEPFLRPFAGKMIFIFHGSEDLNIPVGTTRSLVEKLKETGARVTYEEEPKGHESPGEGTVLKFRAWLREALD